MRYFLTSILACFTMGSFAQEIQADSSVFQYFIEEGVAIDSCSDPALYNSICPWIETPYAYGKMSRHGTDCSGFTKNIYNDVYKIELLGGSRHIFKQCVPIEKEYLEEGDLVFFKIRPNTISHIGIYLRDGKFVHASTRAGVTISSLEEPYYQKYFFSGGRLGATALE